MWAQVPLILCLGKLCSRDPEQGGLSSLGSASLTVKAFPDYQSFLVILSTRNCHLHLFKP